MRPVPAPGNYKDVPFETYCEWDAINQSSLMHLKKSPAHLRWALDHPREETDSMRRGHVVHTAIFEPTRIPERYLIGIDGDGRTKEIKDARAELAAKAERLGLTVIKPSEFEECSSMAAAVRAHPKAREYIESSLHELSIVWVDPDTALLCKARLDAYAETAGLVGDAKTTGDVSAAKFAMHIFTFNYHNQAAFYRSGLRQLQLNWKHHVFIAVEESAPYGVITYRLDDEVMDLAAKENKELLRKYAWCVTSKKWPSYSDKVVEIGIPGFKVAELEERYAGQ